MAITVKHTKVSTIPDGDDSSLIRPSDWNADHALVGTVPVANGGTGASTLTGYVKGNGTANMTASSTIPNTDITGLGTMSTQNANNVTITGGSISGATVSGYIPTTEKGAALGVATLDAGGKVPTSQIPQMGDLNYQGTWNATTNTPTLTSSTGTKGYYYVVSVAGTTNLNGITDWQIGDWAVFNGTVWQKIDNTDAVTSVNGYTGAVVLTASDIGGLGTMAVQNANSVAITGGAINGTTIGATTPSTIVGTTITGNTAVKSPYFDATSSAGGALRNASGTNQIQWGAGGGNNVTVDVSTNLNGTNAQIDISPTGTGHVHINPAGSGSVQINPTSVGTIDNMTIGGTTKAAGSFTTLSSNANTSFSGANCSISIQPTGTGVVYVNPATTGAMDNMIIGATTPKAITGTTITGTTFNGSGSGLTNVVNSLTASTGISVSGSTGAVTVTNTAPDQTVAIASGTGISVTGTYPNFTVTNTSPSSGGTVTSITAGTGLSGGTITTSGTIALANTTVSSGSYTNASITVDAQGRLTSASSGTAPVTSVGATAPIASSGGTTPTISISQASTSTNGYLSSTDWNTFNNKQPAGTYVTSVSGTTGRITSSGGTTPAIDLASGIATPSTTGSSTLIPVITVDTYGRVTSITTASNPQGTVTSVTGTAPVVSSGGATPAISMAKATGSVDGYLSSTDWTTFNNKGSGTVTSVAALTLGTTGTDLSSTVATGTTTPVITLNVPTASASNRGALSSTDWTTFNNKAPSVTYTTNYIPYGQGTTTPNQASNFTFDGTTQTAPIQRASNGIVVNSKTVSANYTIASGDSAMSAGPMTVASGVTVTISSGSRWVVL